MSGATAWKPAAASAPSWWRHEYQDSGKPWHRSTKGPLPCSTMLRRMPLVSMIRCVGSLMISFPSAALGRGQCVLFLADEHLESLGLRATELFDRVSDRDGGGRRTFAESAERSPELGEVLDGVRVVASRQHLAAPFLIRDFLVTHLS